MGDIKPQRYFGYFSLRTGTVICGVVEVFIGGVLWIMLNWIRPQLHVIAALYVSIFTLVGCLGIVAGVRRSVTCTWIFTLGLLGNIVLSTLIGLEFVDAIHFLPQPPVAPTSKADEIPLSAAANVTPLNAVVGADPQTIIAKTNEHAIAEAKKEEKKEEEKLKKASKKAKATAKDGAKDRAAEEVAATTFVDLSPLERAQALEPFHLPIINEDRLHDAPLTHSLIDQLVFLENSFLQDSEDQNAELHDAETAKAQAQKQVKGAPAKGVAEEELSVDELPAVYGQLSRESQMLLEAQLKGMKHVLRMGFGVTLLIMSLLRLYHFLCSLSWALIECRSFDSLQDAPDQYEPLIAAPEEKIGANDLDLDDEGGLDVNAAPVPQMPTPLMLAGNTPLV